MSGRRGPTNVHRGGPAGASDVGNVPVVEIAVGRRLALLAVVGIAFELATSVLVSDLQARNVLSSAASHAIHVVSAFVGLALAFFWILFRPLHSAWRERETRLRDLLRSRTDLDRSLSHVFERMTIGLAFLDAAGRPVRTNRAFRDLLGADAATGGKALYELLDIPGLKERLESVVRGESGEALVAKASTLCGPRMLNVFLTAAPMPSGGDPGVFVSIEDQTARWAQGEELQKSEQFYRAVVDESRDMILRLTPDGKVLLANSAGERMLEALGERSPGSLLPDSRTSREEVESVRGRRAALSPEAPKVTQSARIVLADGRVRRLEWAELGFFDGERRLAEIHVVGRDVTELAETRLRLEESEARYRTLFTGSQTALLIVDPATGRLVDANPRTTRLTGFSREELQDRPVSALFLEGETPVLAQMMRGTSEREGASGVEAVLVTRDGRQLTVEALTGQLADWDGRPLVLIAVRDVSRKRAEMAAVMAREAELRALFHAAPIGIGLFRERIFLDVNDGLSAILGYSADELIGRPARLLYPSDEAYEEAGARLYDRDLVLRKGVGETTVRFRRKDGVLIDVLLAAAPFDPADPGKGVAVAVLDVTAKLAMEAEMRRNDVLLRLLSGHAPAIFWTTDERLRVTSALGAPVAAAGYDASSSTSIPLEDLLDSPEARAVVSAHHRIALETGSCSFRFERAGRSYDASLESIRGPEGEVTGVVGVAVDTTERRLADERSKKRQLQLQLLLSIARIALGPHETRQILRAVAEEIRREFHMPLAAIGLVDRRKGRTILAGSAGARPSSDPEESVRPRAPLDATLAGEVVTTGRTALISGEDVAGRLVDAGLEGFAARTYLGAPIRARGEVIGVVSVASPEALEVSAESVTWLEAVVGFVALVVERRQAGDELLKLSRAVEQSQVAVLVLDPVGRIEYANPFFCRTTGYDLADALGRDPRFLEEPDASVEGYGRSRQAAREGRQWAGELPVRTADGRVLWWSVVYSPVLDASGRITNIVTVAEDVTVRKAAVEELRHSREKLRALWSRLATLQEEERRHLAHELHEGLGQTLAGLSYGMTWAGRRVGPGLEEVGAELTRLAGEANGAIEALRKLTRGLRPASLDLDTVAALETEVAAFRRRTGIPCGFSSDPDSLRLRSDLAMVLFRVLQEGLRNAALHGDPDEVEVRLRLQGEVLRLEVADDGRGADDARPLPDISLGLSESSERIAAFGGHLRLESNHPKGTLLVVEIPVPVDGVARRL